MIAKPTPTSPNLDDYLSHALTLAGVHPSLPQSKFRVLALNSSNQSSLGEFHALEIKQRIALLFDVSEVVLKEVKPYSMMSFAYPRNIPWTMFPVISPSRIQFDVNIMGIEYFSHNDKDSLRYLFRGMALETNAFLLNPMPKDIFYMRSVIQQATLIRNMDPDGQIPVLSYTLSADGEISDLFYVDVAELERSVMAAGTFQYSYTVNSKAILAKALCVAMDNYAKYANTDEEVIAGIRPRLGTDTQRLLDKPIALQVLYALRRAEHAWVPLREGKHAPDWNMMQGVSCFQPTMMGDKGYLMAPLWLGTGKHPPQKPYSLAWSMDVMLRMGIVCFPQHENRLMLSECGHAFLDMLHPDCEDPDCILRWRDADGIIEARHQKSVERWLTSFFRKAKTRLNTIQA